MAMVNPIRHETRLRRQDRAYSTALEAHEGVEGNVSLRGGGVNTTSVMGSFPSFLFSSSLQRDMVVGNFCFVSVSFPFYPVKHKRSGGRNGNSSRPPVEMSSDLLNVSTLPVAVRLWHIAYWIRPKELTKKAYEISMWEVTIDSFISDLATNDELRSSQKDAAH